jgi:hypothetical protein
MLRVLGEGGTDARPRAQDFTVEHAVGDYVALMRSAMGD